jgi:hypothetical protein
VVGSPGKLVCERRAESGERRAENSNSIIQTWKKRDPYDHGILKIGLKKFELIPNLAV